MKCQILFSGKNKKNIINLSSAENAQRVVKVNKATVLAVHVSKLLHEWRTVIRLHGLWRSIWVYTFA